MTNQTPARHQGNQIYEIQERRLVGDAEYIGSVTNRLTEQGVLVWVSKLRFDPSVGSYVVVRYRTDRLVNRPVQRPSAGALAIASASNAPVAASRRPWVRPAIIAGSIVAVLVLVATMIIWSIGQLQKLSEAKIGAGLLGFLMCLAFVGWLIALAGERKSAKKNEGMGFHYGRCE